MKNLNKKIQEKFNEIAKSAKLFRVNLTGQEVWDLYLASFPKGEDPTFRDPESSEHNCNHCKNFIRRYGNIVSLDKDFNIISIFGVEFDNEEYGASMKTMDKAIKKSKIVDIFTETFDSLNNLPYEKCNKKNSVYRLGIDSNSKVYTPEEANKYGGVKAGIAYTFNHFHLDIPSSFVDTKGKSIETIQSEFRSAKEVFKRGLDEISLDTLVLVKDLINQNSLLNGTTYLPKIDAMIGYKKDYDKLGSTKKDNWTWFFSYGNFLAKFRNELIGVLCTELSEGMELNKACKNWNHREDPLNKMKPTAPITQGQIEAAKKLVEEGGFTDSFDRRPATMDDIKVSEILHSNIGDGKLKTISMFDNVKATSTKHKRSEFDGVEEVSIEKFMADILPNCTSVEAYLTNSQSGNLVTLTTANNPDSKRIFKWDNNYSWTFNGNLAGKSQLAEMVEAKGGRTDGVFRFTHSWNELEPNQSLMDLHVFMPGNSHAYTGIIHDGYGTGRRVGWNMRTDSLSGGKQDVDYTSEAPQGYIPVENITFPDLSKMPEGTYVCKVHNWSFRKTGGRGKAEIAFAGDSYQYEYPATKNKEWVTVAEVTLKNGVFSINHKLPLVGETTKEIYGLETNNFHKVELVCKSPNHWGEDTIDHKFYFFMLQGCKYPNSLRTFHNENLIPELYAHRKVLEVIGATQLIEPTDKQLSGLGFNSTIKDELILRLSGSFKRVVKVKF